MAQIFSFPRRDGVLLESVDCRPDLLAQLAANDDRKAPEESDADVELLGEAMAFIGDNLLAIGFGYLAGMLSLAIPAMLVARPWQ